METVAVSIRRKEMCGKIEREDLVYASLRREMLMRAPSTGQIQY